jgi:phosphoglycolate phosphatase
MPSLKAVLLDLDGTLVDSAEDIRAALNRALAERGLRRVGLAEVKGMIGDGSLKLVERGLAATGGDPGDLAPAHERFLECYGEAPTALTRPYPEVLDTLRRLREAGLKLAVVTNKPASATRAVLGDLDLADLVDAVVGGDTASHRKPHPAPLLLALERLGVAAGDALMVGDNHHDVTAARAAGLRAYAVTYGYSHKPVEDLGADRLIERFSDLLDVVEPA